MGINLESTSHSSARALLCLNCCPFFFAWFLFAKSSSLSWHKQQPNFADFTYARLFYWVHFWVIFFPRVWNRLQESSKCKCCSKPHYFSLLVFFLLSQVSTRETESCCYDRRWQLKVLEQILCLCLSLSLSLSANGMEGPCAGDSSKVIWSACRQFWGPSKINHCCVRFHRDTKVIDPYAFWGGTRLRLLCVVLREKKM